MPSIHVYCWTEPYKQEINDKKTGINFLGQYVTVTVTFCPKSNKLGHREILCAKWHKNAVLAEHCRHWGIMDGNAKM